MTGQAPPAPTISQEMEEVQVRGLLRVEVRDGQGKRSEPVLELRHRRIKVRPPIGKQKRYPPLTFIVPHPTERDAPKGRKPVEWKLLTDLPVHNRQEAIEEIDWCAGRWKIETCHKVLKSGRSRSATHVFTPLEMSILDRLVAKPKAPATGEPPLNQYLLIVGAAGRPTIRMVVALSC